ncbi:Nn.00g006820.m01.CDS01 [Neocucurbitaria sp. VM-36]
MPFICRVCIAQPILEGLGMLSISSTSEAWEPHPLEFTELTSGIVGALIEDEVLSLIHKGYRDAAPVAKTNGLSDFVREFGTKVLKIGEADVVMMENMFRGLEIKTEEDKMRAMESLFSALGLA